MISKKQYGGNDMKKNNRSNIYAEQFFNKKINPGIMGEGFIGINTDARKEKSRKRMFPDIDDLME